MPSTVHKGSNFSVSLPTLVIVCLFIFAITVSIKWFFTVILICTSLVTNDVQELVSHLCIFQENIYLDILLIFYIELFVFRNHKNSLYILNTNSFSVIWFANRESHSYGLSFHSVSGNICNTKVLNFLAKHGDFTT